MSIKPACHVNFGYTETAMAPPLLRKKEPSSKRYQRSTVLWTLLDTIKLSRPITGLILPVRPDTERPDGRMTIVLHVKDSQSNDAAAEAAAVAFGSLPQR
jgi:hypothetical protein